MAATPATMLRIVSTGLQDIERLNPPAGRPRIETYITVFRRRSRWASQWKRVDFDNLADFGRKATVTLPVSGELITRAILVVDLPDIATPQKVAAAAAAGYGFGGETGLVGPTWNWTNSIGHALASELEFTIGGQIVDRLDSRLMEILDEHTQPVEHFDSTNTLIGRAATGYSTTGLNAVKPNQTVELVPPFWWNRGPGPQALPIQALAKDKVQISVTFRPIQQCVYTDARVNPANPGPEASEVGPMPLIAGATFYQRWAGPGAATVTDITREPVSFFGSPRWDFSGRVLPGYAMPAEYHFQDAYWLVEYVSLEDREAAAFRNADLQIPIEQHIAVPVTQSAGAASVRVPLPQGGLVRDMMWVAQRPEATDYNAYFLFSRDLAEADARPTEIPWWPDAQLPNWDYGDGYIRPAFVNRQSDPIQGATLFVRGQRRFDLEGPSLFRSVLPVLGCRRGPLIDRYIYRYDFGFWPTGGLAEALTAPIDQVRGFSNWDKLANKELLIQLNVESCSAGSWTPTSGPIADASGNQIVDITALFGSNPPAGIQFSLTGATPSGGGAGQIVSGIVDYTRIRAIPGFQRLFLRTVAGGSTALVAELTGGVYKWIAVAGAGSGGGGNAGDILTSGTRADTGEPDHSAFGDGSYGGGGGGRGPLEGPGLPDGTKMPTNSALFVTGFQKTGGSIAAAVGGDGYYGGGSGSVAGGGGGSYISSYARYVTSIASGSGDAFGTIAPLAFVKPERPEFNLYIWLTTYNLLRVTGGRGALMFSA